MRIAVNTRFLLKDYLEGYGYFLYEVMKRITASHPEHEFIFIFDRPFDSRFVFSSNITAVVVGPPARHPLLWKLWYDIRIPALLKKYKADVFVSCDGFCSLSTSVPQCLVVHDLSFLHFPKFVDKSHLFYLKRYTPRFLKKANSLATVSEFSKLDIQKQYNIAHKPVHVVYSAAKSIFKPLTEHEQVATRERFTSGHQYFLYTGSIHPRKNMMNVLKAFSIFKKKQQSNFKLVLAGRLAWKYENFMQSLKTYKYRNDVIVTGYLDEKDLVALTSSAYAMLYVSMWEGFGVPVLEAMQCHVPVITSQNSAMEEIGAGAVLLANPHEPASIAEEMLKIYKDEKLREELIQKGKSIPNNFTWDRTASLMWNAIESALP